MSMENRERSLPDWLTNIGDEKPLTKKKRQAPNSNETGRSKRNVNVVRNGTCNSKECSRESVLASPKNVESIMCGSSHDNDSPKKVPPFELSSSEDEFTHETTVTNPSESSNCEGTKKNVIVDQSTDIFLDDTEQLSPILCEKVTSPSIVLSAVNEDVDQPDSSTSIKKNCICLDDAELSPSLSEKVPSPSTVSSVVNDDVDQPDTSTSMQITSNSVRRICKYGEKCFRKNPQHLQDFAHPGDDDFNTVDSRPECVYGLSCYRKNPLHRQNYKHTKNVRKPRKAKRPQNTANNNSDSDEEDDYDLDDTFINDGSSDDYEPEGSDSETDFSDAAGSEEDMIQLQKESKRLKRRR